MHKSQRNIEINVAHQAKLKEMKKRKEKRMHCTETSAEIELHVIRMIFERSFKKKKTNKLKVKAFSSQTFSFFCCFCEWFFLGRAYEQNSKRYTFPLANLTFAFACMHIKFAITCILGRRLLKMKEFSAVHFTWASVPNARHTLKMKMNRNWRALHTY